MPEDYEQQLEQILDIYSKELDRFIDESFLKKVFRELSKEHKFFDLMRRDEYMSGKKNFFYDVCVNIAMIHWFNCISLSDEEIKKRYDDETYIRHLKKDVIDQCKLDMYLRNNRDDSFFAHIPIFLSCHSVIEEGIYQLEQYLVRVKEISIEKNKKEFYSHISFQYMFNTADSILLLLEDSDINNAYTLLRTLIEMLYVYVAIFDNEEAIDEYDRFFHWRLMNENGENCPLDFENEFGKRRWKNQPFLNYGWLHVLDKDTPLDKLDCTFKGVFNHAQIESAKSSNVWLTMYKKCCKYVHGNPVASADPKKEFFEISSYLSAILSNIADIFTFLFDGISFKCDDIYLIGHLKNEQDKLENTWGKYYKNKKDEKEGNIEIDIVHPE